MCAYRDASTSMELQVAEVIFSNTVINTLLITGTFYRKMLRLS